MNEFEKGLGRYLKTGQLLKIQAKKIGIAGAGGLGSNIAHALVRTGFKDFMLVDNDSIEPSNLNRQNYYIDEIGWPKIDMLSKRLRQINPDVQIQAFKIRLDSENVFKYFDDRDIIFEAFDGAASKKMLLEAYGNSSKFLVFGCGMAGIANINEIKIKKIKPSVYFVGDSVSEASIENPPLAPRVMACASLMASVAVEHVLSG